MGRSFALALLYVLGAVAPCLAGLITVDPSGGGDYLTLPEAWGPAGVADTVLLVDGTHLVGHGQPGWPLTLDPGSPSVMGPGPPGEAVLLGDGVTAAFCIYSDEYWARIRLRHLTFRDIGDILMRWYPAGDNGGTLEFTDNIVEGCGATSSNHVALDASNCGQSVIARNIFRSNPAAGLLLYHNSGLIQDNEVCNNTYGMYGVCCETPTIERNHIHHNTGGGIGTSFSYTVSDNLIEYNGHGIWTGYGGSFTGNTIRHNEVGVLTGGSWAYFHGNDVYGNTAYNVEVEDYITGGAVTWDCTMNWWGTTDPAAIAASIWDRNDNPEISIIVGFDPWCEAPGCDVTPVEASSWGAVKALFR